MNKTRVVKKIFEIEMAISKEKPLMEIGFFSGEMGVAVFYHQMYLRFNKKEYREKSLERLVNIFDAINNGYYSSTICSGISSVLIGINYISAESFIDFQSKQVLVEKVHETVKIMIDKRNFDFLHGSTGIIWMLLHCESIDNEVISYYVDGVYQAIEFVSKDRYCVVQRTSEGGKQFDSINLSLSHGVSSIIITLARIISMRISEEKATESINNLCSFMLGEKLNDSVSLYPSFSQHFSAKINASRLAWCYGDIGVMFALKRSGEVLNNSKWITEANLIFRRAMERKSINDTKIFDTGLCHGSGGLVAIFHSLLVRENDKSILPTLNYWLDFTLDHGCQKNGLAGFTKLYDSKQTKADISVLSGIAGIGLMLLSALNESIIPSWYSFFMID